MDWALVVAGFFVGGVVGLTGMGGGALMTPMLVLFFGVPPLAAVSSDLVASAVMKPVGGLVHLRRGTVNLRLVAWLCAGSVPAAFVGVLLLRSLGDGENLQGTIKFLLGLALVVAAASLVLKAYAQMSDRARRRAAGSAPRQGRTALDIVVRPIPTLLVGVLGGVIVGMTSVGSGSLIIICLLALYPLLSASSLVGTDLVQAVPLVASAALAHLLFGDFRMDLTAALVIGAVPGVWIGARTSAGAPGGVVRRALTLVLLASGLKLLGVGTVTLGIVLLAVIVVGVPAWALARKRNGLPAFWTFQRRTTAPSDRLEVAQHSSP